MNEQIIEKTIEFVQKKLSNAEAGHDWWHVLRVWKNTKIISTNLHCNQTIVQLAALLHDISDAKFNGGDEELGGKIASQFLESIGIDHFTITQVVQIIDNMSFRKETSAAFVPSIEFQIVQDADRLDAIGAIGIARTFAYGGYKMRPFYDPENPPVSGISKQDYKKSESPTINHFYEKLFHLKNAMNTQKAREIAESRHNFMLKFVEQFYAEWNGQEL